MGSRILVGVVDSGWDRGIVDARVRAGVGLVDPEDELAFKLTADDQDRIGHGTACADLVLRIAPACEIVPIRVFGNRRETSVSIIKAGLEYATERRLNVVNLSLGTLRGDALRPLYEACGRARDAGAIVVAAQHNVHDWSYPAVFDNVIGVRGAHLTGSFDFQFHNAEAIECSAQCAHAGALWLGGGRRDVRGSSFAAPVVSGTVALLLERHASAGLDDIRLMLADVAGRRTRFEALLSRQPAQIGAVQPCRLKVVKFAGSK